jgi:hypothetical protein
MSIITPYIYINHNELETFNPKYGVSISSSAIPSKLMTKLSSQFPNDKIKSVIFVKRPDKIFLLPDLLPKIPTNEATLYQFNTSSALKAKVGDKIKVEGKAYVKSSILPLMYIKKRSEDFVMNYYQASAITVSNIQKLKLACLAKIYDNDDLNEPMTSVNEEIGTILHKLIQSKHPNLDPAFCLLAIHLKKGYKILDDKEANIDPKLMKVKQIHVVTLTHMTESHLIKILELK